MTDHQLSAHLARPESSCTKTLTECLQHLEATRPGTDDNPTTEKFQEGLNLAYDMLRSALADHGIEVSPDQDDAPQPDPLDEEALALAARASQRWSRTLDLLGQVEQADPLDENDHRDRLDLDGDRWEREGYEEWVCTESNGFHHGPMPLAEVPKYTGGPLTFADTPQAPQEAQKRPQTASERAALADIAQAAHELSQAICDWLDLKEDQ